MAKIDLDFFEKIIFQQCMSKNSEYLASCVEYLDKSLFKNKDIAAIMDIIKSFYLENNTIPTITEIKTRLTTTQLKNNFKDAVEELRQLDKDANPVELTKNSEYFFKQRSYYNLLESSVNYFADKKELDPDTFHKEIDKINSISLIDNLGLDYFSDTERVTNYLQQEDIFISTGYKGLDDAFGGGLFKEGKAFYCIGGETNVGKSIVLGNIVTNVLLQNLNVVIFTLEMSEMRYAKRISSMLTGLALATLKEKIDNYKEYIEDFKSKYISRLIIKEFPTKAVSAKNLYAFCQQLERKKGFKPNLMVFDYHALLKPSITQGSKHAEMQYITQEARGMTYLMGCPGISVAQLNRGSHNNSSPGLNTVSGSWDMLSDLDGHINIWQTDEDREANLIRYSGKKARDGSRGHDGALRIDYDTLRLFDESESSTDRPENNVADHFDFSYLTQ